MTEQLKKEIIRAAVEYMNGKGMSQNALCSATKINVGYLGYMLKGDLAVNGTTIADKWFIQLAEYIGFTIEKTYFETRATPQFKSIIACLEEAKDRPRAFMLIGPTGSGKTLTTDKFVNQQPVHTYRITVGSHYRLGNILNELLEMMGVETQGLVYDRVNRMAAKLAEIRRSGGKPVIIIDEAENLKFTVIQLLKSIYDKVIANCSLVLIGTEELINKIRRGCNKGYSGFQQFMRRFKAGIRIIPAIDLSFDIFLNEHHLDRSLVKLLRSLCFNYGELRDYLEPVLRESDLRGEKLTEDFFRMYHNIPK